MGSMNNDEYIGEFDLQMGYDCLFRKIPSFSGYCPCDHHAGSVIFLKGHGYCNCSKEYVMYLYSIWTVVQTRIDLMLKKRFYKDPLTLEAKRKLNNVRMAEHHPECEILTAYINTPLTVLGEKRICSPLMAIPYGLIQVNGIPEWNIPPPPWSEYKIFCDSI